MTQGREGREKVMLPTQTFYIPIFSATQFSLLILQQEKISQRKCARWFELSAISSGVFEYLFSVFVNFEYISRLVLMFLLLTWNR